MKRLRQLLFEADIALVGNRVSGSITYLPYGTLIRERFYNIALGILKKDGFNQIVLTDLIDNGSLNSVDKVSLTSMNYYKVTGTNMSMAAGHEIPFYLFLKYYLDQHKFSPNEIAFPLKYFHFGSVYRFPKDGKFPFNLGERKSFLECYSVYMCAQDAEIGLEIGINWNRELVNKILKLPSIEVIRPLITNKPFSHKTICIDTITPYGSTIITGMTYFHSDIFSRALDVKYLDRHTGKKSYVYVSHFGISENIFFSYLVNSLSETGFKLLNILAPIQVSIIDLASNSNMKAHILRKMVEYLNSKDIRHEVVQIDFKRLKYFTKQNLLKGIPLSIIIKPVSDQIKLCVLFDDLEIEVDVENIFGMIDEYLKLNDENIFRRFKEAEERTIQQCVTVEDVISTVDKGKIAVVYCKNSDDRVLEVEAMVIGGEILGFKESNQKGVDFIDGHLTNSIAIISRRL